MTTSAPSPSPVADPVRELVVTGVGVCAPPAEAAPDWFDYRTELGAQGYKYVPRAAQYLLAAAKRALADAELEPEGPDDRCGVVLGSNNCASQLHADIDREVADTGTRFLRPATVPYFSVNLFLARLGIEHGWRGLSLALHTPATAGVETVAHGYRVVRDRDVDWLVLGATETPPDANGAGGPVADDGAAVLIVEPASRAAVRGARVHGSLASSSLFIPPSAVARDADAEVERLRAALAGHGVSADIPVRLLDDSSPVADVVSRALPRARRRTVGPGCLSPVLEVADILRSGGPGTAVVCANAVGTVAVTVVVPARPAPGGNP
ncbi:beta-ketoacyl synthase N-terminal-like domain-containing protein [Saccharothrix isguenensis]